LTFTIIRKQTKLDFRAGF